MAKYVAARFDVGISIKYVNDIRRPEVIKTCQDQEHHVN